MGSVVGEKISRAIDHAIDTQYAVHHDQQVGRRSNDGGRIFANANG